MHSSKMPPAAICWHTDCRYRSLEYPETTVLPKDSVFKTKSKLNDKKQQGYHGSKGSECKDCLITFVLRFCFIYADVMRRPKIANYQ